MTQEPLISFKNISVSFGKTTVHKDISFSINKGETVTILGPSGTGKTVLLKLIIGLLMPTSGEIIVEGKNTKKIDESELLKLRENVGMLFQGAALFDSLNVFENIAYSLREKNSRVKGTYSKEDIEKIVNERLSVVGLQNFITRYPAELSGGQKKRIGLARALASSPKVVLFDEPTTGLDPTSVRMIDELIINLREEYGITSIVVTHDIESARRISTRWILLAEGVVKADGIPNELLENNDFVQKFIAGMWE